MKKLATIPSFLLSSELASSLKLETRHYIMLIPQSILTTLGLESESLTFELLVKDGKLSLIGPSIDRDPRVKQPGFEEIVT